MAKQAESGTTATTTKTKAPAKKATPKKAEPRASEVEDTRAPGQAPKKIAADEIRKNAEKVLSDEARELMETAPVDDGDDELYYPDQDGNDPDGDDGLETVELSEDVIARAVPKLKAAGFTLEEAIELMETDPDRFERAAGVASKPADDEEEPPSEAAKASTAVDAEKSDPPKADRDAVVKKLGEAGFGDDEGGAIADVVLDVANAVLGEASTRAEKAEFRQALSFMGEMWAEQTRSRLVGEGMEGLRDDATWAKVRAKARQLAKGTREFQTPAEAWEAAAMIVALPEARKVVAKANERSKRSATRNGQLPAGGKRPAAKPETTRDKIRASALGIIKAGNNPNALTRAQAQARRYWNG
ncbi:MAG: hypothetical protein RIB60_06085 [Phycisphaerales bacterium]